MTGTAPYYLDQADPVTILSISAVAEAWAVAVPLLQDQIANLRRMLESRPDDPSYPRQDWGYLEDLVACETLLEVITSALKGVS